MRLKTPRTNPRGPMKIWVPKTKIVDVAGMSKRKRKAEVDSGCSRHMMGEKSMFLTLTMKEGGIVGFGGNQTGKIIGMEQLVIPQSQLIMCGLLMD